MNSELLDSAKDNGRTVIPFTTKAGVQIGRCYQPRLTPQQATWGEKQAAPKGYGALWWLAFVAVSVLAVVVIARSA